MIRVLHVVNGFHPGGVETQLLHVLSGYDRTRFRMDACVIGGEPGELADEAISRGAEILSCRKSADLRSFSRRFAEVIRGRAYAIVHSHFEAWSGAILRGASLAGVQVRVAQLHGIRPWPSEEQDTFVVRAARYVVLQWGRYWLCRYATHLLAVSQAVAERRRLSCRGHAPGCILWTGGVDTQKFSPHADSSNQRLHAPTVVWVGALRPVKRVDLALHIFRLVRDAVPDARFLIVGGGTHAKPLREMAAEMGLTESALFLGARRDIPEILRSATVFLSCSEAEGLPTVLLEAQAAGVPVVASAIDPHREALAEEMHRHLFSHDEPGRAAQSIIAILQDPNERALLSREARCFVERRYRADVQLRALEDLYGQWVESAREDRG